VWIDARSNVHPIHSETDGLEGFIDLDSGDEDAGSVTVGENPTGQLSLAVANLKSGNQFEDRELQKRIDARRYPTISGELSAMKADGGSGQFHVSGELTFRGTTKSYEDRMTITKLDPTTIRLEGAATFDIRDFGMEPPKILMLRVQPDVSVRIELVATKEG
jgi:polyisoprenoid-binding protein YceI